DGPVRSTDDSNTASESLSHLATDPAGYAQRSMQESQVSYSVYELARWDRLCGKGKITLADLRFLHRVTPAGLPEVYGNECSLPSFGEAEVEQAWSNHCAAAELSLVEQDIVSRTTLPRPCGDQ